MFILLLHSFADFLSFQKICYEQRGGGGEENKKEEEGEKKKEREKEKTFNFFQDK